MSEIKIQEFDCQNGKEVIRIANDAELVQIENDIKAAQLEKKKLDELNNQRQSVLQRLQITEQEAKVLLG
jgi:hypothetical protein